MRTSYLTKPYERAMEVFQDFTGGLNTISAPDSMQDKELNDILNEDIGLRGSLKRRYGLRKIRDIVTGTSQGYFRFYKSDGTYEEYHAIGGQIYKDVSTTPVTITNLTGNAFQTTLPVEGVQMNGILYVATGTKLVQYDGTTWQVVDAYLPTTMEMTYIGTNSLADNPLAHLKDTIGSVPSIDYIYPAKPTGVVNQETSVQVYGTKVSGDNYEYAVTVLKADQTDKWAYPTIWHALDANNAISVPKVAEAGDYQVIVDMRHVGDTSSTPVLSEYSMPYTYNLVETPSNNPVGTSTVHTCNRVLVYGSRMFLYGDPSNPALVYISQVNTPSYVPGLLTLEFENPRREPLTCVIPYRNGLMAFTKTSTQYLTGTSPETYTRRFLHTEIGCISPFGAAAMQNEVGFLSTQGVMTLKTSSFTDDKASLAQIDLKIQNIVPQDTNAIAIYEENQLKIIFPATKTRLRYYQNFGAWTKDYSDRFDITGLWILDNQVYVQRNGAFYVFDKTVFNDDDYNYTNMWESKYLSFGQPYHPKKLRELQILAAPDNEEMSSSVYVFADETAVITPDTSYASVVNGAVVWNPVFTDNFYVHAGTEFDSSFKFGDSVLGFNKFSLQKLTLTGRCQRARIRVVNTAPIENQFIGFSFIFKVKKPN